MKNLINFIRFIFLNKNSFADYLTMRRSYIVLHQGNYFRFICFLNSLIRKKYKIEESEGVLGKINKSSCDSIIGEINKNGFYVFEQSLSSDLVDELYSFAANTPMHFLEVQPDGRVEYSVLKETYLNSKTRSNRHQFNDTATLFNSDIATKLFFDKNFLHIANEYLNARPFIDIYTMWWSNPIINISDDLKGPFKDSAAQMYHYDMDRLKFLKFFIYLTDVTEENGPHVYVRESHKMPSDKINYDGRYTDEFISENFSDKVVKLTGKKGAIMAVDTRGIHKGLELMKDERLIYQLQFTNSLFGCKNEDQYNNKFDYNIVTPYKETYSLFVNFQK
jgi:hypothetical protein